MADSDDEYDRRGRGRDKFRRERNDYGSDAPRPPPPPMNSGGGGGNARRDDWPDRTDVNSGNSGNSGGGGLNSSSNTGNSNSASGGGGGGGGWSTSSSMNRDRNQGGRRDYGGRDNYQMSRNSYGGRDSRYSPGDRSGDMSPPSKRMRSRDWGDDRYPNYELGGGHHGGHYGSNRDSGGGGGYHRNSDNWSSRDHGNSDRGDDEQYQPAMLTLKQFLHDQDDHIDEQTLLTKYQDYKTDFRKTQIQEFFNRHKDEEWFRCKYFPDEIEKNKERRAATNQRRLEVFIELFENKYFDNVSLDVDKADQIVRVLDAIVIKLEGGSDFDLKSLDEGPEDVLPKISKESGSVFAVDSTGGTKASGVVVAPKSLVLPSETAASKPTDGEDSKALDSGMEDESGEIKEEAKSVDQNDDAKSMEEGEEEEGKAPASPVVVPPPPQAPVVKAEVKDEDDSNEGELMEEGEEPGALDGDEEGPKVPAASQEQAPVKPRPLHKTCSIFFRNLAPSITKQEIEDECRKFPGFLRLALSEPQMDRRFNRRGWATYERTVNIREICWALNSVKIRGTEIGPIVNRDLTRRIRSVNGISSHKSVVRADIRHAAKLIMKLDEDKGLWKEDTLLGNKDETNGTTTLIVVPSRNPLLKNITDYLIEEASAEEEELLGTSVDIDNPVDPVVGTNGDEAGATTNGSNGTTVPEGSILERDEDLILVLDRLLFYLRIVHSTDYYSHSEYPSEDEMPNRIGLIHARGLISSARVAPTEISDYLKEMETKVQPLLAPSPVITPEEAKKLGLKQMDDAVEAFIKENTKELGEGKWLCPLSNKKFMGPEFVRKHILNKHMERVDQVKAEAHYFNNYVLDPKRPQLPEHPSNQPRSAQSGGGSNSGGRDSYGRSGGDMHGGLAGGYGGGGHGYQQRAQYGPGGRYNLHQHEYGRNNKRRYRDLDAPVDEP